MKVFTDVNEIRAYLALLRKGHFKTLAEGVRHPADNAIGNVLELENGVRLWRGKGTHGIIETREAPPHWWTRMRRKPATVVRNKVIKFRCDEATSERIRQKASAGSTNLTAWMLQLIDFRFMTDTHEGNTFATLCKLFREHPGQVDGIMERIHDINEGPSTLKDKIMIAVNRGKAARRRTTKVVAKRVPGTRK